MDPLHRSAWPAAMPTSAATPEPSQGRSQARAWQARLSAANGGGAKLGRLAGRLRALAPGDGASVGSTAAQIAQALVQELGPGRVPAQALQGLERSLAAYLRTADGSPSKSLVQVVGRAQRSAGQELGQAGPQRLFVLPPRGPAVDAGLAPAQPGPSGL